MRRRHLTLDPSQGSGLSAVVFSDTHAAQMLASAGRRIGCRIAMANGGQDEIVAFLSDAAHYGFPGARVERVETHCSIVFVVDDRAFKLKRAVAFSALDYSTVERREAACRAELVLNRRTAPDLYLGIRAIRRTADGTLAFGDDGPAVDWVVVMRRFDQADLFDHMAEARRLTPDIARALADEIARFHAVAERTPGLGGAFGMRDAIERNRDDQLTVESILGHAAIESVYAASLVALKCTADRFDRRRDTGMVRRCHGDLRLANICLFDDRPTLFDAVEFSEPISCIDVLFDLAFLLMDLHQRGLDLAANVLMNRYLDTTGDAGGLEVLPLMLSVRAATRAYTLAAAVERHSGRGESAYYTATARAHLALAASWLVSTSPRLIAIGGVDSSAKRALATGLAATFSPAPGARVLRESVAVRQVLQRPVGSRLSAADEAATADVGYDRLESAAALTLRAGFSAVVDADFVDEARRRAIARVAANAAVPFVGFWFGSVGDIQPYEAAAGEWHTLRRGAAAASNLTIARSLAHAGGGAA